MSQEQEVLVPGSGLAEVIHDLLEGEGNSSAMQSKTLTDEAGNYRVQVVSEVKEIGSNLSTFLVKVADRSFEITVQEI